MATTGSAVNSITKKKVTAPATIDVVQNCWGVTGTPAWFSHSWRRGFGPGRPVSGATFSRSGT